MVPWPVEAPGQGEVAIFSAAGLAVWEGVRGLAALRAPVS